MIRDIKLFNFQENSSHEKVLYRARNLSDKIFCPAIKKPVVKVRDNLIWFKNISYPFKIPSNDDLHTIKGIYGVLVQYRLEWYIKEFTYDDKPLRKNSIKL